MNIILALIAFNLILIIHELGHFLVARFVGVKVQEFSLFIGPKIYSKEIGETKYTLRTIPLAAYVKMEGEEESSDSENSFSKKSLWARMAIVVAGPIANIVTALIILTIVFSITGYSVPKVGEILKDSPAYEAGLQKGDKIVKYGGVSVYNPLNVLTLMYVTKGETTNVEFMRNGVRYDKSIKPRIIPENNYIIGFVPKAQYGKGSNVVDSITEDAINTPNSVGNKGLLKGDTVIKLGNTTVEDKTDILSFMNKNGKNLFDITIIRNGKELVINNVEPIQNKVPESYDIGIYYVFENGTAWQAFQYSAVFSYSTIRDVAFNIGWLITKKVKLNQLAGPVGIVTTMNEAAKQGTNILEKIISLMRWSAYISIAVGATNLIPFPALDGSKLLLYVVEAIRGKPITVEKEAAISMVGFIILITLAIFVTSNDIMKLTGH